MTNRFNRMCKRSAWIAVAAAASLVWVGDVGFKSTAYAAEAKQPATRVERLFEAIDAARRAGARDSFDVQAVIEMIGRDPQAQVNWVRDNTRFVPYHGALRGATGVLMDRLGNHLDRAVLLAEMLQASGYEVRLANTSLDAAKAKELLASLRSAPALAPRQLSMAAAEASRKAAPEEAAELEKMTQGVNAKLKETTDALAARLREHVPV
ncbi:MAG TPA: hypothetical protein VGB55_03095, partial [Tepidisphaeraceae bacterium]